MSDNARPKVLIVDDEHVIADTLTIILRQHGYDAYAVYGGKAAVESARSTIPDVIISDVMMPDIDGIQAAIHIRGFLPECKILLFSGQALTADLLKHAIAKGYDFELLPKPLYPNDLLARLRSF